MSMFKKSRRWVCGNLLILAGLVAIGAVAPPTTATAEGTALIPQCQPDGCIPPGSPNCTTCTVATDGMLCGLSPGPGTGICKQAPPPVGCSCQ
jgi:hypothetical protein